MTMLDAYGNPATTAAAVTLKTSDTSTGSFRNSANTATITRITIAAGSSSATFLYKDTKAGSAVLTASSGTLTAATQGETITAAAASQLAFTSAAPTLTTGVPSGAITVELRDAFGNVVNAANETTVTLATSAASSGVFLSSDGVTRIVSVVIAAGSNSASFLYKDSKAGSATLTASSSSLKSATQVATIEAAAVG